MSTREKGSKHEMLPNLEVYHVRPGTNVSLDNVPSRQGDSSFKAEAKKRTGGLQEELKQLLDKLYATRERAVLIVLQAMDAAGKDSTIRRCFGPLNPQRVTTSSFRQPSRCERRHDYLWRIHMCAPKTGTIGIFNRSHYEAVLIEKVKEIVPVARIEKRYNHLNAFEHMLADEGTTVLKFYLHVSKAYQKKRLERRLRRPDKLWKFSKNDVPERRYWNDYMRAYEELFSRCSTNHAPWFVVPSERRWYRDLVITEILVRTMRSLDPGYPQSTIDPDSITIPD